MSLGFRNFGNTRWLDAALLCLTHTVPIYKHLLREDVMLSAVEVLLGDLFCSSAICYCASEFTHCANLGAAAPWGRGRRAGVVAL